ncbi:uncharacterized protein [Physcomitrium patens]|uniref:uncharacterized protein n=1 Tax=Physcomitrium patens TaxID=3218 RepID=UPI003CCC9857
MDHRGLEARESHHRGQRLLPCEVPHVNFPWNHLTESPSPLKAKNQSMNVKLQSTNRTVSLWSPFRRRHGRCLACNFCMSEASKHGLTFNKQSVCGCVCVSKGCYGPSSRLPLLLPLLRLHLASGVAPRSPGIIQC